MIPNPESLDQGLIVSVQAPAGSPMRDPDVIASMFSVSGEEVEEDYANTLPAISTIKNLGPLPAPPN